jgi:ABC-type branched-subunit amino acid transport system substrate-binding protein
MDVVLLMPISGPAASIGTDCMNSAKLAYEDLPEEIRRRMTLRFDDTQMKPAVAVNAFRAQMAKKRPDAVVVGLSESTNAVGPITGREKTVMFGIGPSRAFLENNPFAFRHWVDPEGMSPMLVSEILRQGIKKIAVLHSEHPAQAVFAAYFIPYANAHGLKVVSEASFNPEEVEFRGVISQILSKDPEAIVYFALPPQPSALTRQIRNVNRSLPLFAFINTESLTEIKNAQGAMNGVVYTGPAFSEEYIKRYAARFAGDYPEGVAGSFYDVTKILGKAVEANVCSGEELKGFLSGLKSFSGIAGSYGVNQSREFELPVELRTIRDNWIERYVP